MDPPPPPSALDALLDSVYGTLAVKKTGSFADHSVEAAFRGYVWLHTRTSVWIGLASWTALQVVVSAEFELGVYRAYPVVLVVLAFGRVLPLLLAALWLTKCRDPRWMLWWSPVCAVAVSATVLSSQLVALLCSQSGAPGETTPQCSTFASRGLQPWLPVLQTSVLPLFLVFCVQVRLWHATVASLLSVGGYAGMVLSVTAGDAVATSLLVVLLPLLLAEVGGYAYDRVLRSVFRREVANRRKLTSWMQRDLSAALHSGQHKGLADLVAKADVCIFEVQGSGAVTYASPACRRHFGVAESEREVLLSDISSTILTQDAEHVIRAWNALLDTGVGWQGGQDTFQGYETEVLPFVRLQYRRRVGDRGGFIWVESTAHLLLKRAADIPGSAVRVPAGSPSLLVIERDVMPDRQAALRVLHRTSGSSGVPVSALPALPSSVRVLAASLTLQGAMGGTAGLPDEAVLAAAGILPPFSPAAPSPALGPAYDPFHERAGWASLAALCMRTSTAYALSKECHDMWAAAQQTVGEAETAAVYASASSAAASTPLAHDLARNRARVGDALSALMRNALSLSADVMEAAAVSKWRAQALPVSIHSIPVAVHSSLHLLVQDAAAWCATSGDASRVSLLLRPIEEGVPTEVRVAPRRWEHAVSAALRGACDVAAGGHTTGGGAGRVVTVTVTWTGGSGDARGGTLLLALTFDAYSVGGLSGLRKALFDEALLLPVHPLLPDMTPEVMRSTASASTVLPLLRLEVAAMGGSVSVVACAGGRAGPEGAEGARLGVAEGGVQQEVVTMTVAIPCPPVERPLTVGPSMPHSTVVASLVAACPVDAPAPPPSSQPLSIPLHRQQGPQPSLYYGPARAGNRAPDPGVTLHVPVATEAGGGGVSTGRPSVAVESGRGRASPSGSAHTGQTATRAHGTVGPQGQSSPSRRAADARDEAGGDAPPSPTGAESRSGRGVRRNADPAPGAGPLRPEDKRAAPYIPTETSGMRVLFVDDEEVNRRLGLRMLARLGCKGRTAEDGDEVTLMVRAAQEEGLPFDAILLDINMHRMSGVEACIELRATGERDLPIIAMTGATSPSDIEQYGRAGFDLVLPKPFDSRNLEKALIVARNRKAKSARMNAEAMERRSGRGSSRPSHAPPPPASTGTLTGRGVGTGRDTQLEAMPLGGNIQSQPGARRLSEHEPPRVKEEEQPQGPGVEGVPTHAQPDGAGQGGAADGTAQAQA